VCNAPDLARFARSHDIPYDALVDLINAAVTDNALRVTDQTWTVTKWDFYQNADPTNADRQRKHRDKKKAEKEQFEPESPEYPEPSNARNALRNASNTTEQNRTEQNKKDISSQDSQAAPVPVADINIDIKPKAKATKPDASWFGPWFEEFKTAYPKRPGNNWKQAATKLKRLFEGSNPPNPNEVLNGAKSYAKTNPEPQFTAHVTTWVNQARWAADYSQVTHTPTKAAGNAPVWTPEDIARMMGEE